MALQESQNFFCSKPHFPQNFLRYNPGAQEKADFFKNLQKKLDIQKFLTILPRARAGITQW